MIISHKLKFIFIKTQKTAGSSIEADLSTFCGDEDIITKQFLLEIEGFQPRNFGDFKDHHGAKVIREKISPKIWDQYYKFCFERNPYDKMVSWYWDKIWRGGFEGSFKEFCFHCSNNPQKFPMGIELYTIDNIPVVDFIGKYETLKKDFDQICTKLGIPHQEKLSRLRSGYRQKPDHYSQYYDEETKKIIEKHYSREISMFGYSF